MDHLCHFVTCRIPANVTYYADFHGGPGALSGTPVAGEVRVCPTHAEELRYHRRKGYPLVISQEGWVYPGIWMDGLGFLV